MKNTLSEQQLASRVSVLEQALSQLGQGIILLSNSGDVLFLTDVAQQMVNQHDGLTVLDGKLIADIAKDNARLQGMLDAIVEEDADRNYKNFYIHRNNNARPYLLQVSKIGIENANGKINGGSILIVIRDMQANTSHWIERLKANYSITNREADFAVLLTEGRSINEISEVMGIAEETARQYLKNCFKKMEVQKQHELVCIALDYSRKR